MHQEGWEGGDNVLNAKRELLENFRKGAHYYNTFYPFRFLRYTGRPVSGLPNRETPWEREKEKEYERPAPIGEDLLEKREEINVSGELFIRER